MCRQYLEKLQISYSLLGSVLFFFHYSLQVSKTCSYNLLESTHCEDTVQPLRGWQQRAFYTYLKRGHEIFDDVVSVCRRVVQQMAVCKTKTNCRGSAQLRTSCHIKPRSCTITKIQCPFLRFLKDFFENFFFAIFQAQEMHLITRISVHSRHF